ncbi:MAG: hypothetical protein KAR00_03545 [Candidatus Pacebacteria bacterium]|nr:hypothetical protein [Candidatus Paceibacterota bacterium]
MQNTHLLEEDLLEEGGKSFDDHVPDKKENAEEETYDNYEKDWDEEE